MGDLEEHAAFSSLDSRAIDEIRNRPCFQIVAQRNKIQGRGPITSPDFDDAAVIVGKLKENHRSHKRGDYQHGQ